MKQYHGKFGKPKDDIAYEDYNCSSYWRKKDDDSTLVDSTEVVTEQHVILDENGNVIEKKDAPTGDPQTAPQVNESHQEGNNSEATEKKKKKTPVYEDVYL